MILTQNKTFTTFCWPSKTNLNFYHYSFEKYMKNYLPSFSIDEIEKLDMLSNKNAKYLLYKFNDWIESLGGEKILIRHSSKVNDIVGLQKIEEKDKQFLIEKNIYEVEKEPVRYRNRKKAWNHN